MASKYIQQFPIPDDFPDILIEFTTEILRNQPLDIIDFGVEYFRCLEEQKILDYPHRGQNIPCDFKPSIPTIPSKEKKSPMTLDAYLQYQQTLKDDLERKEKMKEEAKDFESAFQERLREMKEKEKEEDEFDGMMIGGGEIIEPDDEIEIMQGGGVMIDVEEEKEKEIEEREIEEKERQKEIERQKELERQKQIIKESEVRIMMIGGGEIIEPDDTKDVMVGGGEIIIPDVERDIMEGGGIIIEPDDTKDIMEGGGVMIGDIKEEEENILMEGGGVMIEEVDEEEGLLMEGGGVMIEEADEEEGLLMEGGGVMIDEVDEEEGLLMEGGGVMIEKVVEKNDFDNVLIESGKVTIEEVNQVDKKDKEKENNDDDNILMEEGPAVVEEVDQADKNDKEKENNDDDNILMEEGPAVVEEVDQADKNDKEKENNDDDNILMEEGPAEIDEVDQVDKNDKENENNDDNLPNGDYLNTQDNFNEIKNSSPMGISLNFSKLKHYEDCIDFEDKESELEKLKNEDNEEIENYINTIFTPNKNINDIIIKMQKTLNSLYKNKGTENEEEYNEINEELKNKLLELKLQILENDYKTQALNDAISDFRSYDYYDRIVKCYSMKLNEPFEDDNKYLDEFSYFLFNNKLGNINKTTLEKYPYIKKYFSHNIELLQPDIYSFAHNYKNYSEDEFNDKFNNLPIKKRELFLNYFKLIHLDDDSSEKQKYLDNMNKKRYISSLNQIYLKLSSSDEENKNTILPLAKEKLDNNYPKISKFIDEISSNYNEELNNEFKSFKLIERNIILEYLKLKDLNDIYDKLDNLEIDEDNLNFYYKMKEIYKESENVPELNMRNKSICINKSFESSDKLKEYLNELDDKNSNEEDLINKYKEFDPLTQEGIYYYSSIINKDDGRLNNIINQMKSNNNNINNEEFIGGYMENEENENKVDEENTQKKKKKGVNEEGLESDTDKEFYNEKEEME